MSGKKIEVMEVCPRDGWQNLKTIIPLEKKREYVEMILDAGVRYMQLCSFVSPKAVPQMATARELARDILAEYPDRHFNALIPNLRGGQLALECGIKEVSFVISASESHNKANVNRTVAQSVAALDELHEKLPELDIALAVATSFGCPFEGDTPVEKVMALVDHGVQIGLTKIELSDTIGAGAPTQVYDLFRRVRDKYPHLELMAHMHDTRNNGIVNSFAALMGGADILHGALGGLGGCLFAPGASGNTSTEDLVFLLEKSGYDTGIDFDRLLAAARKMHSELEGNYSGHQITVQASCL